ncbi:uncharacterized protein BDR25DRAFT_357593 [Lindgomyces ingoldianus]|uniref:Uncharacterized protein n=1 Tax=Lindgomyces ingoldianus TaxID=673940 RepID=A0ACB6QMQ8_9PLEO|nr:uncharacterized protein BDR25DRAFT_357593 [Lindgomyces ingoldianus]KAF2468299.1 hypothetical protein BDR25DRAFT_357593 [Lindgomyces ingoldianus]
MNELVCVARVSRDTIPMYCTIHSLGLAPFSYNLTTHSYNPLCLDLNTLSTRLPYDPFSAHARVCAFGSIRPRRSLSVDVNFPLLTINLACVADPQWRYGPCRIAPSNSPGRRIPALGRDVTHLLFISKPCRKDLEELSRRDRCREASGKTALRPYGLFENFFLPQHVVLNPNTYFQASSISLRVAKAAADPPFQNLTLNSPRTATNPTHLHSHSDSTESHLGGGSRGVLDCASSLSRTTGAGTSLSPSCFTRTRLEKPLSRTMWPLLALSASLHFAQLVAAEPVAPGNCTLPPTSPLRFSDDCKLLCRSARWTDVLIFYLGNYAAHAATTKRSPGESVYSSINSIIAALFFPTSGVVRGTKAILSGAIFANTELQTAAKAGAIYAVKRFSSPEPWFPDGVCLEPPTVRKRDLVMNFTSLKIHGRISLPASWYLEPVKSDTEFENDTPRPGGIFEPFKSPFRRPDQRRVRLANSYSAVKSIVALIQAYFAIATLYRSRGTQIDRFGYAAFGLTVAPYAFMSVVNLFGNLICPEYPAVFIVENAELDRLRECIASAGKQEEFFVEGTVGRITLASDQPIIDDPEIERARFERSLKRLWVKRIPKDIAKDMIAIPALTGAVPISIVGGLSGFKEGQSTHSQRVWTMTWLVFGIFMGVSCAKYLRPTGESTPLQFLFIFFAVLTYGVSAVGGFVVVGQMITQYGTCVSVRSAPLRHDNKNVQIINQRIIRVGNSIYAILWPAPNVTDVLLTEFGEGISLSLSFRNRPISRGRWKGGFLEWQAEVLVNNTTRPLPKDLIAVQLNRHDPIPGLHVGNSSTGTIILANGTTSNGTKSVTTSVIECNVGCFNVLSIASILMVIASLFHPVIHYSLTLDISSLATRNNLYIPLLTAGTSWRRTTVPNSQRA